MAGMPVLQGRLYASAAVKLPLDMAVCASLD